MVVEWSESKCQMTCTLCCHLILTSDFVISFHYSTLCCQLADLEMTSGLGRGCGKRHWAHHKAVGGHQVLLLL